jgi:hypothetical protein
MAVAEVLRQHGVEVQVVRSIGALTRADIGPGTTVVMANPEYLGHENAATMGELSARADRLVLMAPTASQLTALRLPLASAQVGATIPVTADCQSTVARRDDLASQVDVRFIRRTGVGGPAPTLCFALPDLRGNGTDGADFRFGAAMATVPAADGHPEVVALGLATGFTNQWAGEQSHAGIALRALGHSPRLIWYQPGVGDLVNPSGTGEPTPWPQWLAPAAAVLAVAIAVLALVRGRRMGALVREPLPVVVRAVETTESRGRIYRRARDRARAAAILRAATMDRLGRRLAVAPHAGAALVTAASHASGMPVEQVGALLAGPPPATDLQLQALASSLTDLEERVRTS